MMKPIITKIMTMMMLMLMMMMMIVIRVSNRYRGEL